MNNPESAPIQSLPPLVDTNPSSVEEGVQPSQPMNVETGMPAEAPIASEVASELPTSIDTEVALETPAVSEVPLTPEVSSTPETPLVQTPEATEIKIEAQSDAVEASPSASDTASVTETPVESSEPAKEPPKKEISPEIVQQTWQSLADVIATLDPFFRDKIGFANIESNLQLTLGGEFKPEGLQGQALQPEELATRMEELENMVKENHIRQDAADAVTAQLQSWREWVKSPAFLAEVQRTADQAVRGELELPAKPTEAEKEEPAVEEEPTLENVATMITPDKEEVVEVAPKEEEVLAPETGNNLADEIMAGKTESEPAPVAPEQEQMSDTALREEMLAQAEKAREQVNSREDIERLEKATARDEGNVRVASRIAKAAFEFTETNNLMNAA